MAQRHKYPADIGGQVVFYSAVERNDRGKWVLVFNDEKGNRQRKLTAHDIRGKNPPDEFHAEAVRTIRDHYRPPSLFPSLERKGWDELVAEVQQKFPHTRPETIRQFKAAVKAFREVLPDVASPTDVSEEKVKAFRVLWLAGKNKQHKDKPRSPVTFSYYVRGLSALSNHLIDLGYISRNLFHGVKVPKADKTPKYVPTEDDVSEFFGWLHTRYPEWRSLHALVTLKAVTASRTADVCKLKTTNLTADGVTFTPDIVKTKEARSVPLPSELLATLKAVAGPVHLWEGEFWEGLKKFRKQSNGLPESFQWHTVYVVVNNIFREFSDQHPDRPRFNPHALRRRAITVAVMETGSIDQGAKIAGVHQQTASNHYLDHKRAFDTAEVQRKVTDKLVPKLPTLPGESDTKRTPDTKQTPKKPRN